MNPLTRADREIVQWLNQGVGRFRLLDEVTELLVSDYFIPVILALTLLGLWFWSRHREWRARDQRAIIASVVALGIANLAILLINDYYFRPRPFLDIDLTVPFYLPTDSSFPANPAALSFALAFSVWQARKPLGWALLLLAALWSLSRVYAGVFYLSDAAAGAAIGGAIAYLVFRGLDLLEPLPTLIMRVARALNLA